MVHVCGTCMWYMYVADTYDYSADYINDPYNSRDLNPMEPMNHGCGSRREYRYIQKLSGCMSTTVCTGMFM